MKSSPITPPLLTHLPTGSPNSPPGQDAPLDADLGGKLAAFKQLWLEIGQVVPGFQWFPDHDEKVRKRLNGRGKLAVARWDEFLQAVVNYGVHKQQNPEERVKEPHFFIWRDEAKCRFNRDKDVEAMVNDFWLTFAGDRPKQTPMKKASQQKNQEKPPHPSGKCPFGPGIR